MSTKWDGDIAFNIGDQVKIISTGKIGIIEKIMIEKWFPYGVRFSPNFGDYTICRSNEIEIKREMK